MSYVDVDTLRPPEMVAQYILACKGQALFLPYQDYAVIDEWLASTPGLDALLLILAEVVPPFFAVQGSRPGARTRSRSLGGLRKLVLKRLHDLSMHQP